MRYEASCIFKVKVLWWRNELPHRVSEFIYFSFKKKKGNCNICFEQYWCNLSWYWGFILKAGLIALNVAHDTISALVMWCDVIRSDPMPWEVRCWERKPPSSTLSFSDFTCKYGRKHWCNSWFSELLDKVQRNLNFRTFIFYKQMCDCADSLC